MKRKWVITTDGTRPLADVARGLRAEGFEVEQTLREIGCLTGAADDAARARLEQVPGVASVEPEVPIDLGPGDDDDTTW